uniref:Uncharacterized protein n=1 Tax=Vitis vinifera TaxID=29760 RepID=A5BI50_VITVI|nr:hypothetical protein VITISV_002216 [Vitis vinifera]
MAWACCLLPSNEPRHCAPMLCVGILVRVSYWSHQTMALRQWFHQLAHRIRLRRPRACARRGVRAVRVWLARGAHLARLWCTHGARLVRLWCVRDARLARPRCMCGACLAHPRPPHMAPGV